VYCVYTYTYLQNQPHHMYWIICVRILEYVHTDVSMHMCTYADVDPTLVSVLLKINADANVFALVYMSIRMYVKHPLFVYTYDETYLA
jgi:hypothetical protein